MTFPRERVAVFIDGCFWHGCPEHYVLPKTNTSFWAAKVDINRTRDRDTDTRFDEAGWVVPRFWEHDEPSKAAAAIQKSVWQRRVHLGSPSVRVEGVARRP